jgi:large subunit ribosomal protein L23
MSSEAHDIILRPILTEKLTELRESQRKIGLLVRADANKVQIRKAAEHALKVKIEKVNIINGRGKTRRIGRLAGKKPDWKKAIVTMKAGEKLEIFEGV